MDQAAESQHAPGPWTVEEYGDEESPALVIHSDIDFRICFMATPGLRDDPETIEANAHLIAAAPDMLAALQDIIKRNEIQHWFNLDLARAAVSKATGGNDTALTTGRGSET
jgi:hypothetical protein